MIIATAIKKATKLGFNTEYIKSEHAYIFAGKNYSFGFSPNGRNEPDTEVYTFFVKNNKTESASYPKNFKKMIDLFNEKEARGSVELPTNNMICIDSASRETLTEYIIISDDNELYKRFNEDKLLNNLYSIEDLRAILTEYVEESPDTGKIRYVASNQPLF